MDAVESPPVPNCARATKQQNLLPVCYRLLRLVDNSVVYVTCSKVTSLKEGEVTSLKEGEVNFKAYSR